MTRIGTVLLAHGSAKGEQQPVIDALAAHLATADAAASDAANLVGVQTAFLDHHGPSLDEAVATLARAGAERVVVVPALLSNAFHARHDVPRVVSNAAARSSIDVVVSEPLGLDARLGQVVADRVRAVDIDDIDHVVIAAAGTGSTTAQDDFRRAVRSWRGGPTPWRLNAAFIAGGDPSAVEYVTHLVDQNQRVVVVPFLLGDGTLHRRLADGAIDAGAIAITEPLGADPVLAQIARDRRAAVSQ